MSAPTARFLVAILFALFVTGIEWAGYGARFKNTGIPQPKDLADIWWHFFLWAAVFYALATLRLFRRRQ